MGGGTNVVVWVGGMGGCDGGVGAAALPLILFTFNVSAVRSTGDTRGGSIVNGGAGVVGGGYCASTLGNGAYPGGGLMAGVVWLVKIVASCCRAALLSSAIGAIGDAGDGLARAVARSLAAAMARSVEFGIGMTTWVGSHASVSLMRSARVSHTHTL